MARTKRKALPPRSRLVDEPLDLRDVNELAAEISHERVHEALVEVVESALTRRAIESGISDE